MTGKSLFVLDMIIDKNVDKFAKRKILASVGNNY